MLAREAVISLPIAQRAHMERFEATERLSELYIIEVDVICEEAEVDFLSHLGEAAQITISQDSVPLRTFSGLIFEAEFLEEVDAGYRYRLTLRPWLYALSRNVDSQIFQQKSALEIIQAVFDQRGCQDYDLTQLQKSYPQRDYCVQYRESDFTFVSRLMEQEGIYYFFDHRDGRHVMVLCDDPASHPTVLYEELAYLPAQQQAIEDRMWRWTETVSTGIENKATFRDFDFTQPTNQLQSIFTDPGPSASGGGGGGNSSGEDPRTLTAEDGPAGAAAAAHKAEIYDFPTGFLDNSRGDTLTETAVQALVAEDRTYRGIGDPVLSACGYKLNLVRHPLDRLNIAYLIVAQTYRMDSQHYVSGGDGADDEQPLVVEVVAAPAATKFRAPQLTPWPVVRGIETAIVVGPDGETIYTDDWGRVKVRFHWDRAEASADQTCWMRVAFASADNGFGHIVLPRIGQEVVVDFLNGDPDRPIVVGSVYNGDKKPAYPLADNKTMSVWRSHTIDGGADDYNEISFEDKNGDEVFNVQAQKDRKTLVKHDDTKTIKNNLTTTVQEGDEKREVSQGKRTTTVQQNEELTVNAGDMKTTVSAGNKSTTVSAGNYTIDISAGQMTVTAAISIELKVGSSSVKLDQTGVTIKGMMISSEAQVQLSEKAVMIQISADALLQAKGAITMIN